jgi:hypothetical protein
MNTTDADSLVCNLAHDLRQPLSTLENCAFYLKMVVPPGDLRIHQHLDLMHSQIAEAERILADTLQKLR